MFQNTKLIMRPLQEESETDDYYSFSSTWREWLVKLITYQTSSKRLKTMFLDAPNQEKILLFMDKKDKDKKRTQKCQDTITWE